MSKPKLERLIKEIAMFDMEAACKLHQRKDREDYDNTEILASVMLWDNESEGDEYWRKIDCKLDERRKNYHPHRDLMIELANDKTIEIEYLKDDGSWKKCEGLSSFFERDKYRKKPKVTKKTIGYRIYLDQENEIHLVEKIDSSIDTSHFKKWLTGWQKFEIEVKEND